MSNTTDGTLQFYAGDLVISIVGDGDGSGTYSDNQATPITLEEITTTGSVVGTMVLPQTTTVVNGTTEYAISGEYGSSSEGYLQLSADGQSLVIGGYGVSAASYNAGGAAVYGNAALAQTTSLVGSQYVAVPRVIADISYTGTVDTSTALYDVYNTNNIRSVATEDGTSFYVGGQGVKGDDTQGVFYAQDGANSATAINTATDVRDVQILDGALYVSTDSKQGSGGTSNVSLYSTLPTTATTGTVLPGIDGSLTLTAGEENGINDADVGGTIHLSPEGYFFADAATLYIADGGAPKEGGLGDGGLQKWSYSDGSWHLDYTLAAGLDLVANTATAGTTGLIGLTGTVVGGEVYLYATNETVGDLDQTYLYAIADVLSDTSLPTDESFTAIVSASADTNIRGISFAPTASSETTATLVVSSGAVVSETVTSGSTVTVQSGGTLSASTILSGGAVVVSAGGLDSGTTIAHGAMETLLGSAVGDVVQGTQLISAAGATATSETVYNGGAVDLFLKGGIVNDIALTNGGVLAISGNATANDTTILSGGTVILESAKANMAGSLVFSGAGVLEETATISAGYGVSAVISGFGSEDAIDLTTFGSGATLTSSVVSGNTVATVTSGGASESFTFAGTLSGLVLSADGSGGEKIVLGSAVSSGGTTIVSSGVTSSGLTIGSGGFLEVQNGGTILGATILAGGQAVVSGIDSGSTISSGGSETVLGAAGGDQIYGTQIVSATNAVVSGETVHAGGVLDLFLKTTSALDTVVDSGGALAISGNAVVSNVVLNGGAVLEMQSPKANVLGTLVFSGAATIDEQDIVSSGHGISATISGWQSGDVINTVYQASDVSLGVVSSDGVTTLTVTAASTDPAVVAGGVASQTFTFVGADGAGFAVISGAQGQAEIVETAAPCFATGTRIRTEEGEVAVEDLAIGDMVLTVTGEALPIRWIGQRLVAVSRHPAPESVRPIRVPAHAFGAGLPARDLILSPDHALFAEGVLVPVKHLVGAGGIAPVAMEQVTYWHVELDRHEVILAEGLPAESYLDTGDRPSFANAGGTMTLHPAWGSVRTDVTLILESLGYAPLKVAGAEVARIRAMLQQGEASAAA